MPVLGRIPDLSPPRSWEYDARARGYDERLDGIDLELEGLARIRCEDATRAAASLGFSVEGIRPLVRRPWESRVERREEMRARAAVAYIPGRKGLVRRAVGEVLGVR